MDILAHRANLQGPDPASENSWSATRKALEYGFGIETDLRRDTQKRYYIAHDPGAWTESNDLKQFIALFREFSDRTIAMNVKELGYEADLIPLQQSGDLGGSSFYFDFELLEPKTPGRSQRLIHGLPGGQNILMASRLSDRGESLEQCLSIPGNIVWADEFDSLWLTAEHIRKIHAAGRKCYVISPELHEFDEKARLERWQDFRDWNVDGLCTDHALAAQQFFRS